MVALVLGLAFLIRLSTLAFPLTEAHPFRQTQTAFTAVIYAQDGIDLLKPQVPIFGPPWTLPFEFPLFQAIASLAISAGLPAEIALRGLSLLCFIGTAGVLWLILRRHASQRAGLIGLIVFAFSPLALLWSRTSMIEYAATLGAMLFMLGTLEWHAGRGRRWFALALVGGSVASLVKVTTAIFWLLPALLTRRWLAIILVGGPALLAIAWTQFADAEKAASVWTAGMTSSHLFEWTFGGDRLSLETWQPILWSVVVWGGMLLAPFALMTIRRPERMVWAWFAIALIGPLLLFTNLYAIHDYYAVAVTPALAALVGGGVDWLLEREIRARFVYAVAGALGLGVVVMTAAYWLPAYTGSDPQGVLPKAAIVRAASPNGEFVELGCAIWNPAVLYYAERRGFVSTGDGAYLQIYDPRVCIGPPEQDEGELPASPTS